MFVVSALRGEGQIRLLLLIDRETVEWKILSR